MNEHQQQTISPDDPKLTAYALGELSGAERAEVETILKNDPAARAAVDEIRALAAQLEGALASEPLTESAMETGAEAGLAMEAKVVRFSSNESGATRADALVKDDPYRKKVIRFPYVWVGSLAAACFAVMVALRENPQTKLSDHKAAAIQTTGSTNGVSGSEVVSSQTAAYDVVERSLAEKKAGTFSVDATEGARATRPVLLVKDADEFAAISAPDVPALKVDEDANSSTAAGASAAPVFAAAAESIKTSITYADTTPPVAGAPAPGEGSVASASEVPPAPLAAKPIQPVVLAKNTPAQSGVSASADKPLVALEEMVLLEAFSVSSDRQRSAYGAGGSAGHKGGRANFRGAAPRETASSDLGSMYGRTDLIAPAGPQMNFRAKSTVPARNQFNTEAYAFLPENDFFRVRSMPLSTFSIDVDTASYANVRRFLDHGQRPPRDAVRVEEMVNYFNYRYAPPARDVKEPFAASMEIATAPWNPAHRLVRIGLKGREVSTENRPAANLVFLLDVSGSMSSENKLPLVKESLRMLVEKLRTDDRVAIVTYAGNSGLALPSTLAGKKKEILASLDELSPGGSTNGAMGIQLAYDIAKANFITNGANRVILCTDGDFNVGTTSEGELMRLIEEKAKSGVFLTVLGFGMGNLKDSTLERLADKGNGNYGYIDSRAEAQKLLVEQAGGTLVTIAKDVKLQVEFNPAVAQAYRLIGYENRALKKEDFNNDKVDAGEIGAGHTVTALYEIVPVGAPAPETGDSPEVDALKYQKTGERTESGDGAAVTDVAGAGGTLASGGKTSEELLTLKIRFKEPTVDVSRKMEIPVIDTGAAFEAASKDFKFAAAVASLGMILRESAHTGASDYDRVISWAEAGKGDDADGRRGEFIELVKKARALNAE